MKPKGNNFSVGQDAQITQWGTVCVEGLPTSPVVVIDGFSAVHVFDELQFKEHVLAHAALCILMNLSAGARRAVMAHIEREQVKP